MILLTLEASDIISIISIIISLFFSAVTLIREIKSAAKEKEANLPRICFGENIRIGEKTSDALKREKTFDIEGSVSGNYDFLECSCISTTIKNVGKLNITAIQLNSIKILLGNGVDLEHGECETILSKDNCDSIVHFEFLPDMVHNVNIIINSDAKEALLNMLEDDNPFRTGRDYILILSLKLVGADKQSKEYDIAVVCDGDRILYSFPM